jgi:hypothetical protein
MNTLNRVVLLFSIFIIASCGGGGGGGGSSDDGGGGGYGNANRAPTITNATTSFSVMENQTAAFSITASDPDMDSLTYSLTGNDAGVFSVSTSGVVTFNTAPDFEDPSDADTNNVYEVTGRVSDGSLTATRDFTVTVTNDTSDDATTEGMDGTYLGAGPIQSATVCIEVTAGTCSGANFTTTTAQDGTFSLTIDSGTTGVLRGEGGFDPVTNLQFGDNSGYALGQPVTNQNFVVTPLSSIMYAYDNSTDYDTFKSKLGLASDYMIRFNDPFASLGTSYLNKAAVVNTQIAVMIDIVNEIGSFTGSDGEKALATEIIARTGDETSLGDTTFIKNAITNLSSNNSDFSPSSDQLVSLSAGISAYMQKINANDSSNSHSHFAKTGVSELKDLMKKVMDGTSDSAEVDKLVFDTIAWINENTSWVGGAITDNEADISKTTYKLTHSGSSYYSVDNVNAKDTEFIIYVREGDVIQFEPTSTVTSNHPFLLSTEVNDMDRSSDIGTAEGWDANSLTLTVGSDTPATLYPHCQFHSGMYQSGKVVKVSSYEMSKIDVTNATSAMQVKGTVSKGPFKGASGHTYKVYLTSQGGSEHTHEFYEYPGLTFYMPADQGYHGAASATDDRMFKPKSHYASSDGGNDDGGGY